MYRKGDGDEIKEKRMKKKTWKRGTKEAKKV
jgi:hypothetical protein